MSTPDEILNELLLIAQDSFAVSLLIGFDHSSIVVDLYRRKETLPGGRVAYERDPGFLELLRDAVLNGGVPIGWYRLKTRLRAGDTIELGLLRDHQSEPWAYEYLRQFVSPEDKKDGAKYFLVYPDGKALDITDEDLTEEGEF